MRGWLLGFLLIASIASTSTHGQKHDEQWSPTINGLRARLIVGKPVFDTPFCEVFIEIQNTAKALGQRRIRFDPKKIRFQVTDETGKPMKTGVHVYDAMVPIWETTLLPYGGTIKFEISFPGSGYRKTDKRMIDLGFNSIWLIPEDGKPYYLRGTLTVELQKGDHPFFDWSGTLELPPVEIPQI